MIKLFKPYTSPRALAGVKRVFKSNQLAEGDEVKAFEKEFCDKFNVKNAVAVNSCSSALELAYELAGISRGDEVITPVLTCTATNIPLVRRGAKIIFADINPDLNIRIEDVKNKITKKTKAIVFVHFAGNNRGLRQLLVLARRKGITIIEDAAQAIGSDYWGCADYTCISFQAIKILNSGDGGMLLAKRKKDFEKAKRLRWFGYDRDLKQTLGDTDLKEAGFKYHMNNISAAIGRANLKDIDKLIAHRKKLAEIYKSYGLFAYAWLAGGFTKNYKGLKDMMCKKGIEIGQHHYRNDKYTIFGGRQKFTVMDALQDNYFFVPFHHGVSIKDAHRIGKLWKNFKR